MSGVAPRRRAARAALLAALASAAACRGGADGGARAAEAPAAADTLADGRATSRLTAQAIEQVPPVAAPFAATSGAAEGEALTVYLLTIGQGDAVWERFGHNALWIRDRARGTDVAYNWGMFDFAQPNFLGRFLTGDTRYWMEGFDAHALAEHYARVENRSVWVQELNLAPAQRAALRDFVEWNAREAHKVYRYDYYRDNCSTRVRDAIDRAAGGALRRATAGVPTTTSYRWHTRRLTAGDVPIYAGIQLALGRPADRPIDAWQEGFLPVRLMDHVRRVRVPGADGRRAPLVAAERQLYRAPDSREADRPPTYLPGFAAVGLLLAGAFALLARAAAMGRRGARALLGVTAGTWTLFTGALGVALLLAGTVTRHEAYMGRNLNLLLVNPLALVLCALVVVAVAVRSAAARARWAERAARVAAVGAALSVAALVILLPRVGQGSADVLALALPANVALWWALRRLAGGARDLSPAGAAPRS